MCIIAHENDHLPTQQCPPGPGPDQAKNPPGNPADECSAYRAQLDCLHKNGSGCGGDAECESQVQGEINRVELDMATAGCPKGP